MSKRPGKHRLSIDIDQEMWDRMLSIAEKYNITVTQLLKQMIFKRILEEQKYE